ncbi:MAG: hypothetical protein ACE14M_05735 [Terriglobales bacterium]
MKKLEITRLALDESLYSIDTGRGTRFLKAPELKRYLLDLGVGDSRIATVLDISPSENIAVEVPEEAA